MIEKITSKEITSNENDVCWFPNLQAPCVFPKAWDHLAHALAVATAAKGAETGEGSALPLRPTLQLLEDKGRCKKKKREKCWCPKKINGKIWLGKYEENMTNK